MFEFILFITRPTNACSECFTTKEGWH